MTTNPRSLAVEYDDNGLVKQLICETCIKWTDFDDLYRDEQGDVWDVCRWCGEGLRRPTEAELAENVIDSTLAQVEVWYGDRLRFDWLTFDIEHGSNGQVPCHECGGTGWWGFGPNDTRGPCVDCKGTGREWVGLW